MSSSSSSIFTGSSTYSQDFQNLITRAVNIASLPITLLNNQKSALSSQSSEITSLTGKFSSLQSALQKIGQSLSSSYSVNSSDTSVVTAGVSAGAVESNYSILVTHMGAYSTMMTNTWDAGAGGAHTYKLYIGDDSYDIATDDNSAASVAAAINSGYGSQVHATVVNVGSNATPDYRLSLQSAKLTTSQLDLRAAGVSLAHIQTAGRPAEYEINGSGNTVSSDSRTVNVATGVTLTIQGESDTAANVTVSATPGSLGSALSGFATAYNGVVTELEGQRGSSGGALAGQSIVRQLSSVLSGIGTYSGNNLDGLHAIGLDLGPDGQMTFNSSELASTASADPEGLSAFIGSISAGGFLKNAADALQSVVDSTTGLLATTQTSVQAQITRLGNSIDDKQTQVDNLQRQLQERMAAADAAVAAMQQQYSYMSNMFQAMQTAAQQYK